MSQPLLHEVENNDETQSFLKENGQKFSNDCIKAMQLMYRGVRLNGDTCKELYKIHDRRLRDCIAGRPDIVRKQWVKGKDGKRKVVEYWIDPIKVYPTKGELQQWFNEYQNEQPVKYKKGVNNASDFALKIIKGGKQTELF